MKQKPWSKPSCQISSAILALLLMSIIWYTCAKWEKVRKDQALITAVRSGDINNVKILLARGADPNARDRRAFADLWPLWGNNKQLYEDNTKHSTALMEAVFKPDKSAIAQLLLDRGANVNAKLRDNTTALEMAIKSRNIEGTKLLLIRGADPNLSNRDGWTPLMWATLFGETTIVRLLLDKGALVNARNNTGSTAISIAVVADQPEIARLLVNHGADFHIKDITGSSAWMYATKYPKLLRILKTASGY